ncbi:MAG: glutathione S-transferase family protein [Pseudomonadota bacterium]
MSELILHHHAPSPFGEKIRLALGLKNLSWRSVLVSMVPPRPAMTALTGGYRKIPVLQIGADIYCDTRRITAELEYRFPTPSLFPTGDAGVGLAIASWSDQTFFQPGAGLSMGMNEQLPADILNDRKAFFNFMDFSTLKDDLAHLHTQFLAQVPLVENQLADGRAFLNGDAPGAVDIAAYFPIWMARANVPGIDRWLNGRADLNAWEGRMEAIGRGEHSDMDAADALAIARDAEPRADGHVGSDPLELIDGDRVTVTPTDYGNIPVEGALRALSATNVSIEREDPAAGTVHVHFPRSGYRIERVG